MRVTLDVHEMRSSMALWRDTVMLCHPETWSSSELRLIERKMLKELDRTLTGSLALLKMCQAHGPDAVDLQDIRIEVADCKAWAAESLAP